MLAGLDDGAGATWREAAAVGESSRLECAFAGGERWCLWACAECRAEAARAWGGGATAEEETSSDRECLERFEKQSWIEKEIQSDKPAEEPERPNHIQIEEKSAGDENTARFFAKQYLNQQGRSSSRWTVRALPERFDIQPGDIVDFRSKDGGLAGRQRVFNVDWNYSANGTQMTLTVGRQSADLVSTLRYAANVSQ